MDELVEQLNNSPNDLDAFIDQFGGMTEEYYFYNGEVCLRYDPKGHTYLLMTPDGLKVQDGVTTVCHIIDKSKQLIPWGCKMMQQKLLLTTPYVDGTVVLTREAYENLINEAKSAHKEKLEEAGQIGHIAHAWIESYIKLVIAKDDNGIEGLLLTFPEDERAKNACIAGLTWMSTHNVRWISTEHKIYSRRYGYAGTLDGKCLVNSCDDPNCCQIAFKDRLTIADWKTSNYLYPEFRLQTAAYAAADKEETGDLITDRWIIRLGKDDGDVETWHMEEDKQEADFQAFLNALYLKRSIEGVEADIQQVRSTRRAIEKEAKRVAKEARLEAERLEKIRIKLEQQAIKAAALKIKCKKSLTYKGKRKPTCNEGQGCEFCNKVYQEAQIGRVPKAVKTPKAVEHPVYKIHEVEIPKQLLNSLLEVVEPVEKVLDMPEEMV